MTKLQAARQLLLQRLTELALQDEAEEIAEAIEKMIEAKIEQKARGLDDDA